MNYIIIKITNFGNTIFWSCVYY